MASLTISFPERELFTRCSNEKGVSFLGQADCSSAALRNGNTGVSASTNGGPGPSVGTAHSEIDYSNCITMRSGMPAKTSIAVLFIPRLERNSWRSPLTSPSRSGSAVPW